KEALAAVEELKRKGPGYKRDISFWGQVGEGAVSLGCVAAAALGQVEFGIPCVLGGAATSAAVRYWSSPQEQTIGKVRWPSSAPRGVPVALARRGAPLRGPMTTDLAELLERWS